MAIKTESLSNMVMYHCEVGQHKLSVIQTKVKDYGWRTYVSGVMRVAFGLRGEQHETYQEMFTGAYTALRELEDVLKHLDQRQREMGDSYTPPILPDPRQQEHNEYDAKDYVVVNLSVCNVLGGHPLCGDLPETLSLDDAVNLVLDLEEEFGHTPETAAIYRLSPLPIEDVEFMLKQARERLGKEE